MFIQLIQKHWTILSLEDRVRKWLLQMNRWPLQMTNMGTDSAVAEDQLYQKAGLTYTYKIVKV